MIIDVSYIWYIFFWSYIELYIHYPMQFNCVIVWITTFNVSKVLYHLDNELMMINNEIVMLPLWSHCMKYMIHEPPLCNFMLQWQLKAVLRRSPRICCCVYTHHEADSRWLNMKLFGLVIGWFTDLGQTPFNGFE